VKLAFALAAVLSATLVMAQTSDDSLNTCPSAEVVTSGRLEIVDRKIPNVCTCEPVIFNGYIDYEMRHFCDANNSLHASMREKDINIVGVGKCSGKDYRVSGGSQETRFVTDELLPAELTQVVRMNILGAGPVPNEISVFVFKGVVNSSPTGGFDMLLMNERCPGNTGQQCALTDIPDCE